MKEITMKTLIAMTIFAITSLTANAYFLKNVHNVSLSIEDCAVKNNVHPSSCQLKVVNTTPKETDAQKLTLLMPPELQ